MQRPIEIVNELGLHARAAARFVELANRFQSKVELQRDGETVDGKSILGILTLAAPRGTKLVLLTDGPDEGEAMDALAALIMDRFGEER